MANLHSALVCMASITHWRIMGKKQTTLLLIVFLIFSSTFVFYFFTHKNTPPQATCSHMDEIPFGPPALNDIVNHSPVIAKGELRLTEDRYTIVRVSEPLKGNFLKKGESIKLCQSNFDLTKVSYGDKVIVFLKGKDLKRDAWSGSWQSYSTAPIDKDQIKIGEKLRSLDEVRKAIKDQK